MGFERFVFVATILFTIGMYCASMLWYFIFSKKRGVYIIEIIAAIIGIIGIIILITTVNSLDIGNAIAAIFGALFLAPFVISSVLATLFVKITTHLISKNKKGTSYENNKVQG